jgi:hypothetical protein
VERLLAGQPGTVTLKIYNEDGVLVDATGSISVLVEDSAGIDVATGTATKTAATTGIYTFTIAKAVTENLDTYTVSWTYTIAGVARTAKTYFEAVGGHLFEIADFRAYDSALSDAGVYPSEKIRAARVGAEQRFEKAAKVAFVPRARTVVLSGDDTTRIVVPDSELRVVYSASIDGVDLTDNEMDYLEVDPSGVIRRNDEKHWPTGFKNIVITYEYGYDAPPEPVKRAVMALAYEALIPSALNPRATSQSTDLGEFRISVANVELGRWTGIPEVDAVIQTFGRTRPAVG